MTAPLVTMLKAFGIDFEPEAVIKMVQDMAIDVAEMRAAQQRTEKMVRELWENHNGSKLRSTTFNTANATSITDFPLVEHGDSGGI